MTHIGRRIMKAFQLRRVIIVAGAGWTEEIALSSFQLVMVEKENEGDNTPLHSMF